MNKLKKARSPPAPNSSPLPPASPPNSSLRLTSPSSTALVSPRSRSRTLEYASSAVSSLPEVTSVSPSASADLRPRTSAEQYWAARALTAETLLSARVAHHEEIRSLSYEEEVKRSQEIWRLRERHEAKQARMEKLLIYILTSLFLFVLIVFYLLSHPLLAKTASGNSGWLASHFTIPILSPFTSVVEHETSVLGTRTIMLITVILAGLAYFVFRYWYWIQTTGRGGS